LSGILSEAAERTAGGLAFETLRQDMQKMGSVKAKDLNGLAKVAIPLEKGVLVLVGDKKAILEQIKSTGLPAPIEVTVRGQKIGS